MKKNSLFSPLFLLLFIENYLFFCSHTSLNLLPPYLTSLGASKAFVGFFMNVNPLELVLFVVFFGRFMNNLPKKQALFTGFLLHFLSMILMFVFSQNLTVLLILRFIAAVSFVFGFTMHANLAFEIIPRAKRAGGIAIFGISGVLSNPTGSILGETILRLAHPQYLFLLGALFSLFVMTAVLFLKDPHHAHRKKEKKTFLDMLTRKNLYSWMFIAVIFGGIFSVFSTFIPNFSLERLGFANLSIYFTSLTIVAILSRTLFSNLLDSVPKRKLIAAALLFMLTSIGIILFLHWPIQLAIVGLIYGMGHSVMYPTLSTTFLGSGNEDEQAVLNNTFTAFYTFGNVSLTTFLGFVGDFFGMTSIFLVTGFLVLACFFVAVRHKDQNIGAVN